MQVRHALIAIPVVVLLAIGLVLLTNAPVGGQEDGDSDGIVIILIPCVTTDDSFEQNDSEGAAAPVSVPFSEENLLSCTDDEDWFSFQVSRGGNIQADITFTDANGDIDLYLYDPDGTLLDTSFSFTNNESVSESNVETTGDYFVRVRLFADPDGFGNQYDLDIETSCTDDAFEDNDGLGGASPVAVLFNENDLRACPNDEDWFSFPVPEGAEIHVDADFVDAKGDIDIELRSPGGGLLAESITSTNDEHITYTAATAGNYAVRVLLIGKNPEEGNPYALEIDYTEPPPATDTPVPTDTPPPTATPTTPPGGVVGDADCGGAVNAIDAAIILQFGAGFIGGVPCPVLADANVSGDVNSIDATLILQFVAGFIGSLPP